jgi:hypothetical protein
VEDQIGFKTLGTLSLHGEETLYSIAFSRCPLASYNFWLDVIIDGQIVFRPMTTYSNIIQIYEVLYDATEK